MNYYEQSGNVVVYVAAFSAVVVCFSIFSALLENKRWADFAEVGRLVLIGIAGAAVAFNEEFFRGGVLAVAVGKYIITREVFEVLGTMESGKSGEIRLADAFDILLQQNRPLYGRMLEGEWLDTGDKFNFLKTTIHYGLKHPEVGEKLRAYLHGLAL